MDISIGKKVEVDQYLLKVVKGATIYLPKATFEDTLESIQDLFANIIHNLSICGISLKSIKVTPINSLTQDAGLFDINVVLVDGRHVKIRFVVTKMVTIKGYQLIVAALQNSISIKDMLLNKGEPLVGFKISQSFLGEYVTRYSNKQIGSRYSEPLNQVKVEVLFGEV